MKYGHGTPGGHALFHRLYHYNVLCPNLVYKKVQIMFLQSGPGKMSSNPEMENLITSMDNLVTMLLRATNVIIG